MTENKSIAEVRNDYRDDETGLYYIDVYLTENDDEEGFSVATVDADGKVEFKALDRLAGYDLSPVHEAIDEAKEKQKEFSN
jgi:Flagellin D3 domain